MYALNRSQIIGHLTQAPEVRQTPNGQMVGDLNIMIKSSFINSSGQNQTSTSFINVVVWRGLADISQRFLKKGSQVFLSGRIQTDEWQDQEGRKRYKTRVVADDLILLDARQPNLSLASEVPNLARGLNQSEVIGNITRDPELRKTPNGDSVCSFALATNFSWKDRSGQEQKRTEYHNVVAWGALSESISKLKKGQKVYVAGRLQTRSWDTPDGQKRWTTEIIADRALALGIVDPELSQGSMGQVSQVSFSQPTVNPAASNPVVPNNPVQVPAVNYESEIKPEDLPF